MKERKKFLLRLPADLWNDIQRLADAELRSANSQIEILLREAVKRRSANIERGDPEKEDH